MITLAYIFSVLSLLMGIILLIPQPKFPLNFWSLIPKLPAGALSPYWAVIGAVGAIIGGISGVYLAVLIGIIGAGIMIWYVWRCSREQKGVEDTFGPDWSDQISPEQSRNMVQKRWTWFLKMKASTEPIRERDVPFWTIPGTNRELLCDIWRPANGNVSGLAFIYLHGGAWWIMEKDFGTRTFFRHLVSQGHTVMDVSYRLCPEVDIFGMIGDVKRAVAWMKEKAPAYGVYPEKIVLGGGSSGCHLALLAAYAPHHPELTPEELQATDLSVRGVVSFYGPADLLIEYKHYMELDYFTKAPPVPIGEKLDPQTTRRYIGRLDILLGGHPQDVPEIYQLASPVHHVKSDSPPTLLIQGDKDAVVPVHATQALYNKLSEKGVPVIKILYPWTDHGFDLAAPQINPAAHSAFYDVDRFLALLLNNNG